jgi:hypothetical protein
MRESWMTLILSQRVHTTQEAGFIVQVAAGAALRRVNSVHIFTGPGNGQALPHSEGKYFQKSFWTTSETSIILEHIDFGRHK